MFCQLILPVLRMRSYDIASLFSIFLNFCFSIKTPHTCEIIWLFISVETSDKHTTSKLDLIKFHFQLLQFTVCHEFRADHIHVQSVTFCSSFSLRYEVLLSDFTSCCMISVCICECHCGWDRQWRNAFTGRHETWPVKSH